MSRSPVPQKNPHELEPWDGSGARPRATLRVGRYEVGPRIAAGGMATVHLGRVLGAAGFARVVAIKRLLPDYASDPEFESMFVEEAQLAARINHPNIVSTLDVVSSEGELLLVMDYVHGEALSTLAAAGRVQGDLPRSVALAVVCDALHGLHAAHEATDRKGKPLGIVHRDVSPQNVIVGADGVARVIDFGIAKAATSISTTREGIVRGKVAYMAPEQLLCEALSRRTDLYAMGVVLWELLAGERLFPTGSRPELVQKVNGQVPTLRSCVPDISHDLDTIVMRALAPKEVNRFADADEMARAIETHATLAKRSKVAEWVQRLAGPSLSDRASLLAQVEAEGQSFPPPPVSLNARVSGTRRVPPPKRHRLRPQPPRLDASTLQAGEAPDGAALDSEAKPSNLEDSNLSALVCAQPKRIRVLLLGIGSALICSGMLLGGFLFRQSPTPEAAPKASAEPSSAAASPSRMARENAPARAAAPTRPTAAALPQPTPVASDTAAPAAPESSSTQPSAPTTASANSPRPSVPAVAHARTRKPRAPSTPKKQSNCNPPYRIDSAGHRVFKAECF